MADMFITGLGQKVDDIVARSPRLKQMIAQCWQRWPKDFRIKPDTITGSSYHTVNVNAQDSPLDQASGLAHELGHLLNRQSMQSGSTFEDFVNRNVEAQIREEASAVKTEIQVRQELRKAGIKVPHLVCKTVVSGSPSPTPYDLEALLNNDKELMQVLRNAFGTVTGADTYEVYWRNHYKQMRSIYNGLSPQPPKSLPKRPSGGISTNISRFLASATPLILPPQTMTLLPTIQQRQQAEAQRQRMQDAQRAQQQRMQEAQQRQTQELIAAQQRRIQDEAQRRAQEDARRRQAQAELEAQQRRAREEAERRRAQEALRRAQEEAQRRQQALDLARIKRPQINYGSQFPPISQKDPKIHQMSMTIGPTIVYGPKGFSPSILDTRQTFHWKSSW